MGKTAARDSSCDLMGDAVIKYSILKLKTIVRSQVLIWFVVKTENVVCHHDMSTGFRKSKVN